MFIYCCCDTCCVSGRLPVLLPEAAPRTHPGVRQQQGLHPPPRVHLQPARLSPSASTRGHASEAATEKPRQV